MADREQVYRKAIQKLMKENKSLKEAAFKVDDSRYRRAHKKAPDKKNGRNWVFYLNRDRSDEPMFAPGNMNYTDAVAWAKEKALAAGKNIIYLSESSNKRNKLKEAADTKKVNEVIPQILAILKKANLSKDDITHLMSKLKTMTKTD